MKPSSLAFVATLVCCVTARAAGDAALLDPARRNAPFAPAPAALEKSAPQLNHTLQERRVDTSSIDKTAAPLAGRQSAIEITEAREKPVRENVSRRPESVKVPTSRFQGRVADVSTDGETTKPPLVAKYQDSLAAASASNMARFPAAKAITKGKLNRFVFRKNPPERPAAALPGIATPAAGESRPIIDRAPRR
jgi:hypothetical protein